ncbi:uncharacterized protein C22orf15 homolog [Pluvialis apricaria]
MQDNPGGRKHHKTAKSVKFQAAGTTRCRQPSQQAVIWPSLCSTPPSHSPAAGGPGICGGHSPLLGNLATETMTALAGNAAPPLGSPGANAIGCFVTPAACRTTPGTNSSQITGLGPRRRRAALGRSILSAMFVTVRYGANCQEMVNLQCRVLILTAHLKRKCQCRPEDCIDLLDETGTLMNLSKAENPASEFASKYLQERKRYILIRVIRGESSEATCYESLLENLGKHYPDLEGKPGTHLASTEELGVLA